MIRRLLMPATLLAAVATSVTVAFAGAAATPGVTDTTILIGGTAPFTGEASSSANVARGADAYFRWVDARGGVNGRQVSYKVVDDASDPAQTIQGVRQLVQQDQAFALFSNVGTNNNLAIRDLLNQAGVPQLFVASGAGVFGTDYQKYPWTIGYSPSYVLEGRIYARTVLKTRPKARIAVLYERDEYGKELLRGLKLGLGARQGQIVAAIPYDPTAADIGPEVTPLRATKADTFMVFAVGKLASQAFLYANKLGWHPQVFIGSAASSADLMTQATLTAGRKTTAGAITVGYLKDPTDPRWAKDLGLVQFRAILKGYDPAANPKDAYYVAGMAAAFTLVDALRKAGRNLTRDTLLASALSLNEANNPFVLPGVVIRTSATDRFPVQQVGLEQWSGDHWVGIGGLVSGS
jgi:branched-chain amino acid transport system substrate-binding protein